MSQENLRSMSASIASQIEAAEAHLEKLKTARKQIEIEGMYPSVPSETWETKNGKGQYLYMLFARRHNGTYAGPEGRRRVYVGSDAAQIAHARRLSENRAAFEQMVKDERALGAHIAECHRQLIALRQNASRWPRAELGTQTPRSAPTGVPKGNL